MTARSRSASLRFARAACALALASPAAASPRSILPDVFGPEPARPTEPARPAEPKPDLNPAEPRPADLAPPPAGGPSATAPPPAATPGPLPNPAVTPTTDPVPPPAPDPLATNPATADIARLGLLAPATGGLGANAFAASDGRVLLALLDRLPGPMASRWGHILLTRALASAAVAPGGIRPADWLAARAGLLVRMGEADVAHALVERAPVAGYTPRLYAAAFEAAMAAADPVALCPIATTGRALFARPVWTLAAATCAAIDGDDITAQALFETVRADPTVEPFDTGLAERIAASAGAGARRGGNADWGETERANLYRFGFATAAGAPPPDRLLTTLPPGATGWLFRAAATPDAVRATAALPAAAQGIVGSGELTRFYAELAARPDGIGIPGDIPGRLRQAYAGGAADRLASLRALWETGDDRYAALVLTAAPVTALAPSARLLDDADRIIAATLAGGRADLAARWWALAQAEDGRPARRAWALAATGLARGVEVTPSRFRAWRDTLDAATAPRRAALVLAALDGLAATRGGGWDALRRDAPAGPSATAWAARLDAAAAAGHVGEVAILCATGLGAGWEAVPPAHLARAVAALARVGLPDYARHLAAEAATRG